MEQVKIERPGSEKQTDKFVVELFKYFVTKDNGAFPMKVEIEDNRGESEPYYYFMFNTDVYNLDLEDLNELTKLRIKYPAVSIIVGAADSKITLEVGAIYDSKDI